MHDTHMDLSFDEVDRDGAIEETASKVGLTRRRAIAGGVLAAGGMVGTGLLGGFASTASAQDFPDDAGILNFALTLEYLEGDFYTLASQQPGITGAAKRLAQVLGSHEIAHQQAILKTLQSIGATPIARPTFTFGSAVTNRTTFLKVAVGLEDTGVAAYKGQAPFIKSRAILEAALGIHSLEAKHATWARQLAEVSLLPAPEDKPLTAPQVLAAVRKTGFAPGL